MTDKKHPESDLSDPSRNRRNFLTASLALGTAAALAACDKGAGSRCGAVRVGGRRQARDRRRRPPQRGGQARRARRVLRLLERRTVRRDPHPRRAVDARDQAHRGVQPRLRDRLRADRLLEGDAQGAVHGRHAPRAPVLQGRHVRRPLRVRERQGRSAARTRRHPDDGVRRDRRHSELPGHARHLPAASQDRLRVLQRRVPYAAGQRRSRPGRSDEVRRAAHGHRRRDDGGEVAGDDRGKPGSGGERLQGPVLVRDLLQLRGRRRARGDDEGRPRLPVRLQPGGDREGGRRRQDHHHR